MNVIIVLGRNNHIATAAPDPSDETPNASSTHSTTPRAARVSRRSSGLLAGTVVSLLIALVSPQTPPLVETLTVHFGGTTVIFGPDRAQALLGLVSDESPASGRKGARVV